MFQTLVTTFSSASTPSPASSSPMISTHPGAEEGGVPLGPEPSRPSLNDAGAEVEVAEYTPTPTAIAIDHAVRQALGADPLAASAAGSAKPERGARRVDDDSKDDAATDDHDEARRSDSLDEIIGDRRSYERGFIVAAGAIAAMLLGARLAFPAAYWVCAIPPLVVLLLTVWRQTDRRAGRFVESGDSEGAEGRERVGEWIDWPIARTALAIIAAPALTTLARGVYDPAHRAAAWTAWAVWVIALVALVVGV